MLTFKPVAQRDLSRLRRYYKNCNYQLCEYSALVKLMWRGHLHPQYAEAAGCLIVKNCIDGKPCFDYPVLGPDGDEEAALCAIEDYCVEQGISLELSVVPKEKAAKLLERYPRFHLNNFRSWRDYIYEANDLREFPGRHYSGQRNHVNKFRKLYPEAQFRALGKDDLPLIERFWQDYTDQVDRMSDSFYYFWIQISDKDIPVELDEDTISINNERYQADTSDLRELLDKTYRDVMSGVID